MTIGLLSKSHANSGLSVINNEFSTPPGFHLFGYCLHVVSVLVVKDEHNDGSRPEFTSLVFDSAQQSRQ